MVERECGVYVFELYGGDWQRHYGAHGYVYRRRRLLGGVHRHGHSRSYHYASRTTVQVPNHQRLVDLLYPLHLPASVAEWNEYRPPSPPGSRWVESFLAWNRGN